MILKAMQKTKLVTYALFVAAIYFSLQIYTEFLRPFASFQYYRSEYQNSFIQCQNARRNHNYLRNVDTVNDLPVVPMDRLIKSSKVELLSCLDNELVRNRMLSVGVDKNDLKLLEIESLSKSESSLDVILQELR